MALDKESLLNRLAVLQAEKMKQEQVFQQAHANVNAFNGAIQELNYQLSLLEKPCDDKIDDQKKD